MIPEIRNPKSEIECRKDHIRAQLKTSITPESTVEMVFMLIEQHGSDRFLEGYRAGIEHMASIAQLLYQDVDSDLASIPKSEIKNPKSIHAIKN